MRLDAYIRVSKVGKRSGESFLSPDQQRAKIEQYAAMQGHTLTWHEPELDVSGGTMKRPIFDAIMKRVEAKETDGIIVAKLDRFSRTLTGALNTLATLVKHEAVLVSVTENIDLSTSMGRAFARILLVFAELGREQQQEYWEDTVASKIARGIHGSHAPYGYIRINGQPLKVDPKTGPVVPEIFELRAQEWSLRRIAAHLNDTAPLPDGKRWSQRNIAGIIKNKAYLGIAFYNKHVNKHAHPALVTVDQFDAASLIKTEGSNAKSKNHPGLLTGIVRCAGCRYVMSSVYKKQRNGKKVPYYLCRIDQGGGKCQAPASIACHLVDPVVQEAVLGTLWVAQGPGVGEDTLTPARVALEIAEDRLQVFLEDDDLRELVSRESFMESAGQRQVAVDEARAAVDEALRAQKHPALPDRINLSENEEKMLVRESLDSVYIRKGPGDVLDRLLILRDDPNEKPHRGRSKYRTTPVPWPDEHVARNWTGPEIGFLTEEEMDEREAKADPWPLAS